MKMHRPGGGVSAQGQRFCCCARGGLPGFAAGGRMKAHGERHNTKTSNRYPLSHTK